MSVLRLKVFVVGTDQIFSLKFFPELDEDINLEWIKNSYLSEWTSQEFKIDIKDNFDYKLIVGILKGASFTLSIKYRDKNNNWKDLINKKEGKPGKGCDPNARNKGCITGSVPVPTDISTNINPFV